ncbi:MAG TPA: phosphatidate cytidylyltransferase, partial [Azonexus sp.]
MLKTRVITALVLLALVLPSLFFLPQSYWALLVALFIGVAAWEWGGLLGFDQTTRLLIGAALTVLCAAGVFLDPAAIDGALSPWVVLSYSIAALFWCAV